MNTTRMAISMKKAKFREMMPNELRRETVKKNANSEGDELSIYSEVGPRGDGDIPSELKEQLNATE